MNSELSQAQEQPRPTFLLIMINNRLTSVTYLKENNARYSLSHLLPHYNILSHNARVQYDICDQIGKEILGDHVPPAVSSPPPELSQPSPALRKSTTIFA